MVRVRYEYFTVKDADLDPIDEVSLIVLKKPLRIIIHPIGRVQVNNAKFKAHHTMMMLA